MKFIHCADVHLGSAFGGYPDLTQANRREEILDTFRKLVQYAQAEGIRIILIAGDLFDKNHADPWRSRLTELIRSAADISFYYIAGNHDSLGLDGFSCDLPPNLFLFSDEWKTYRQGSFAVSGVQAVNHRFLCGPPELSSADCNIVLLHGEIGGSGAEAIPPEWVQNRNIRYIALGHYHTYKVWTQADGSVACYSGCLEGRGADEIGEKGFVVVDTDKFFAPDRGVRFIPFAARTMQELRIDVSGAENLAALGRKIYDAVTSAALPRKDCIYLTLVGSLPAAVRIDEQSIRDAVLALGYYHAEVRDETTVFLERSALSGEYSLRSAFIEKVTASSLSEAEKREVLKAGLAALDKANA